MRYRSLLTRREEMLGNATLRDALRGKSAQAIGGDKVLGCSYVQKARQIMQNWKTHNWDWRVKNWTMGMNGWLLGGFRKSGGRRRFSKKERMGEKATCGSIHQKPNGGRGSSLEPDIGMKGGMRRSKQAQLR